MSEPARGPHDPPPVPTPAQQDLTAAWAGSTPALDLSATRTGGVSLPPDAFDIPNPFGRYTVARLLGRGGMGAVFLAHDTQLARPVALKIPTFRGTLSATQKERFFREARAIAALRHPHICPVFDVDEEQGFLFFTMAYIEGQTLSAVIERGPMAPEKAIELVRKVALAMHAAHLHGTIHRDLKPANIVLDPAGEPVVMDFGLARRSDAGDDTTDDGPAGGGKDLGLTQLGSVLGTPAYMPPEQARGDVAAVGPRSDVYSLGVILFELLTGRRPFVGADTADTIRQIQDAPPPRLRDFYPWMAAELEAVCLRAMAKTPADRFGTMAEFEDALRQIAEPDLRVVLPPPLPPRPALPKKKRRWVAPVISLTVAFTIVAMCVGGPALIIWWLVVRVTDKVKEIQQTMVTTNTEWETVQAFWRSPPADAPPEVVFPPTVPGGSARRAVGAPLPDPDLGLTLSGQRAVYATPDGEVAVSAFRCTDAQAETVQEQMRAFVQRVQQGGGSGANRNRAAVNYSTFNSNHRVVTYGFADASGQNPEYGKMWYADGWLFYFQTSVPLLIESFPPTYLLEVAKKVNTPPPVKPKAKSKA